MKAKTTRVRIADPNHAVITVVKKGGSYRREPCEQCPWRKDLPTGVFPAEAFRISADTAQDAALTAFACHMSGAAKPATCAGFLLSFNAAHNLTVRLARAAGRFRDDVKSKFPLYRTYREMAEANGVAPDDPALAKCRDK